MDLQESFYDIFTLIVDDISEKQTYVWACVWKITSYFCNCSFSIVLGIMFCCLDSCKFCCWWYNRWERGSTITVQRARFTSCKRGLLSNFWNTKKWVKCKARMGEENIRGRFKIFSAYENVLSMGNCLH